MLITVNTTSAKLGELLSPTQIQNVLSNSSVGTRETSIQNLGATDLYVECGLPATVADGTKLSPNDTFSFNVTHIDKINLISETSANANVRVLITT